MNDDSFGDEGRGAYDAADTPDMIEEESLFDQLEREVDADAGSAGFPHLAEAYRREGQIDRAEEIAVAGLAEAPERLGGKVALALVMLEKGEIAEAREALTGIFENVPEVPSASEIAVEAIADEVDDLEAAPEDSSEPTVVATPDEPEEAAPALGDTQPIDEPDEPPVESEPAEHRLYATPLASPSPVLPHFDGSAGEAAPPDEALREDEIENAFAEAEARPDDRVSPDDLVQAAVRSVEATTADTTGTGEYRASEHPVFATETMASLLEGQGDLVAADEVRASIGSPEELDVQDEPVRADEPEVVVESTEAIAVEAEEVPDAPEADELIAGAELVAKPEAAADVEAAIEANSADEAASSSETVSTVEVEEAVAVEAPEDGPAPLDAASAIDDIAQDITVPDADPRAEHRARRQRIIARLEGWLENIRRDPA